MTDERRGISIPMAAAAGIAVLTLYVLSPAPVYLMIDRFGSAGLDSPLLEKTLEVVYAPLSWLCENAPFVEGFYEWYFNLLG